MNNSPVQVLLVSPREAARMLSISERTLYSLTKAGEIPSLKLARAVRYRAMDLENWVAKKISEKSVDI